MKSPKEIVADVEKRRQIQIERKQQEATTGAKIKVLEVLIEELLKCHSVRARRW